MRNLAFIGLVLVWNTSYSMDLEYVRLNFEKSIKDEKLCRQLIDELMKKTDKAVCLGYLGAFQTIMANHYLNPIAKLNTFNKGKHNIEMAIKLEPENVELRIIRLSIQSNCPSFLSYHSEKNMDRQMIKNKWNQIDSESLKNIARKII